MSISRSAHQQRFESISERVDVVQQVANATQLLTHASPGIASVAHRVARTVQAKEECLKKKVELSKQRYVRQNGGKRITIKVKIDHR